MLVRPRGLRDGDFAFGVKGALAADGCEDDRRFVRRAEELQRQIGLGHVDEPPNAQLIPAERLPVRAYRVFAVGAGGEIPKVRGRQYPAGGRLEVEDIERVFRLGDDGRACGRLFPPEAERTRQGQRAGRGPLQQLTARRPTGGVVSHICARVYHSGRGLTLV